MGKSWPVVSINKIYGLDLKQARYREDGKWYHPLESFPAAFFDSEGYLRFESATEYEHYARKGLIQVVKDVHVEPEGISKLHGYRRANPAPKNTKPW